MYLLYILLAIVILLFMILFHEFGHYIAGKLLKFKIDEFSVGFGPAIFSKTNKKTGEKFSFRAFPLGGYCAFDGEDGDEKNPSPTAFNNQKPWKRIIVLLGGVTMNFLTAIIFSWVLLCSVGYDVKQVSAVDETYPNTFEAGDVITEVNGEKIDFAFGGNYSALVSNEIAKAEAIYNEYYKTNSAIPTENLYTFEMTVKKDSLSGDVEKLTVTVYPYIDTTVEGDTVHGKIGLLAKPYVYSFWEGLGRSFSMAFGWAWLVLKSLFMLFTFQVPISDMAGTVGTIATMADYASQSLSYLLIFIPLIAANLAIFNILPIPSLDGAHILFVLIEWIRGKPINREIENKIHTIGLFILLGFVVLIDILHFALT